MTIISKTQNLLPSNNIDNDYRDDNGKRLVATVGERKTLDDHIKENYKYSTSPEAIQRKNILQNIATKYGEYIHHIRGNGDCGLISFATGLLYHTLNASDEVADKTIQLTTNLIVNLNATTNAQLQRDIEETSGLLLSFSSNRTNEYLDNALLNNDSFMLAFSRIIRAIAYQNIPTIMQDQIRDCGLNANDFTELFLSDKPGINISSETYKPLSLLFGLQLHLIELTTSTIQQFPLEKNYIADIVIIREPGHFFSLVPDKNIQARQLGLKSSLEQKTHSTAIKQLPTSPSQLHQRPKHVIASTARPSNSIPNNTLAARVQPLQEDRSFITKIALSILYFLASIFNLQFLFPYSNENN